MFLKASLWWSFLQKYLTVLATNYFRKILHHRETFIILFKALQSGVWVFFNILSENETCQNCVTKGSLSPGVPYKNQSTAWKSVQIRNFFWHVFSYIRTEYRKIWTRKNSVFRHFSRSEMLSNNSRSVRITRVQYWDLLHFYFHLHHFKWT